MNIHLAENWALEVAADCAQAQHSVTISALSMQPPRRASALPWGVLWQAWVAAAARGVRVGIFLAAPCKAHPATLQNATSARTAHDAGIVCRFVPQPNLLHAKSIVVDDKIVWIGSGNMTAAAAHYNHEIYVRFESSKIAVRIQNRWCRIANPA